MKQCFDPDCARPATRELRGLRMCAAHYIEALEHSAHLNFGRIRRGDKFYIPKLEAVEPAPINPS